jgi:N-ethylmaleimide reductase
MSVAASRRLLSPVRLGPYELRNRVVMAPMTRNRAGAGRAPTSAAVQYYEQRASAGLIVTEATHAVPAGVGYPNTPGIHTPEQIAAWRRVTEAVHARGARIFLQIWHTGRISHPSLQPDGALPVAPSPIAPPGQLYTGQGMAPFVTPRALELDELPGIVEGFAEGARHALAAGFDGVEIHGANGYLLDQFLRDGSNHRTDAYGGPVERRARLLLEVTEAVAGVLGAGRVGVRVSPRNPYNSMHDSNPAATFGYVARALNAIGPAYLHVTETRGGEERLVSPALRDAFDGTFIANGGYTQALAESALATGAADLVAFGVPFISNPDLPERFAVGAPLAPADRATFYGGDERGYVDYPRGVERQDGTLEPAA